MSASAPALKICDFHYDPMCTTEDITCYVPGGYHPITVGEILGGSSHRQYRIMHKLGWGSYATVWLAQTVDEAGAFVSLKITTAEEAQTREFEMLQKAAKVQPGDQSQSHVVKLLDYFTLCGPNGIHVVIVTEVVAPIFSLLSPIRPPAWRKAAAHCLAKAMAQIHANGIVHGDWHVGNFGIDMPEFAQQAPEDVMQDLSPPELTIVLTCEVAKQTASLPPYLISSCKISEYYGRIIAGSDPPRVKVFDFGNAHEIGTRPRTSQCATEACAPEMVFARVFEKNDHPPLDPPADIWALGATIYEIVTGSKLFWNCLDAICLPLYMSKLTGEVPSYWEKWSVSLSDKKITQADAEEWWSSRWKALRKGCENDADANALIQLLKRVLVLNPAERPTAIEIANDPWFQ